MDNTLGRYPGHVDGGYGSDPYGASTPVGGGHHGTAYGGGGAGEHSPFQTVPNLVVGGAGGGGGGGGPNDPWVPPGDLGVGHHNGMQAQVRRHDCNTPSIIEIVKRKERKNEKERKEYNGWHGFRVCVVCVSFVTVVLTFVSCCSVGVQQHHPAAYMNTHAGMGPQRGGANDPVLGGHIHQMNSHSPTMGSPDSKPVIQASMLAAYQGLTVKAHCRVSMIEAKRSVMTQQVVLLEAGPASPAPVPFSCGSSCSNC